MVCSVAWIVKSFNVSGLNRSIGGIGSGGLSVIRSGVERVPSPVKKD